METLKSYLDGKPVADQVAYAERCGTSIGYLRKAMSTKQTLGLEIVIKLDKESGGEVRRDELRPDVDWDYLARPRKGARKVKAKLN